ncbi:MAG: cytochrome c biogenesis protein CcdA [Vicinamibacterales bacterium]
MGDNVTLVAAFVAGFLSFISPCVLPLIPGYISFVSGASLDDMRAGGLTARRHVLIRSLAFVVGFSVVFIALGASASAIGSFISGQLNILTKIAGALIIVFGLHMMGVFRLAFLDNEKRAQTQRKPAGPVGAFLVGLAFAFGWTPCIGPILAGILVVAGSRETVAEGVVLLAVYSLGLGGPFLLTSVAIDRFFSIAAAIRRHYHAIEMTSGGLLVAIGVLIFTEQLTVIVRYLEPYLPVF